MPHSPLRFYPLPSFAPGDEAWQFSQLEPGLADPGLRVQDVTSFGRRLTIAEGSDTVLKAMETMSCCCSSEDTRVHEEAVWRVLKSPGRLHIVVPSSEMAV